MTNSASCTWKRSSCKAAPPEAKLRGVFKEMVEMLVEVFLQVWVGKCTRVLFNNFLQNNKLSQYTHITDIQVNYQYNVLQCSSKSGWESALKLSLFLSSIEQCGKAYRAYSKAIFNIIKTYCLRCLASCFV